MHDYGLSVLLGIVEGLTEFIPVSSTAHLRIAEGILNVPLKNEYWKMYSVVIQLGAILSVLTIYGRRLVGYAKTFPNGPRSTITGTPTDDPVLNHAPKSSRGGIGYHPLTLIAIAFLATAIPAYLLTKAISADLENFYVIGGALFIGGIIMWLVDTFCTRPTTLNVEDMTPVDALWIGAVEILSAVFPGTSRSMSTIAAGQVFGLSRQAALDFSFLLSLPVMFAACAYSFLKSMKLRHDPDFLPANMDGNPWVTLAIGFIVSFIIALLVNRWFLHWVKKHGFTPFAIYRVILGVILLGWVVMYGHSN